MSVISWAVILTQSFNILGPSLSHWYLKKKKDFDFLENVWFLYGLVNMDFGSDLLPQLGAYGLCNAYIQQGAKKMY